MLSTVGIHSQKQQHGPEDRELVDGKVVRAIDGGDTDIRMIICYIAARSEVVLRRIGCLRGVFGLGLVFERLDYVEGELVCN